MGRFEEKLLKLARDFEFLDDLVRSEEEMDSIMTKYTLHAQGEFDPSEEWKIKLNAYYLLQVKLIVAREYLEKFNTHMIQEGMPEMAISPFDSIDQQDGIEEAVSDKHCEIIPFPGLGFKS